MSDIDVIVHLTGVYERALNNAAQWRIDIIRLLQTQKDKRFVEIIMNRLASAPLTILNAQNPDGANLKER